MNIRGTPSLSSPLAKVFLAVGLACGGEGGARLAERLAMAASPNSLLLTIRGSWLPNGNS
jgi:hypothetical protein